MARSLGDYPARAARGSMQQRRNSARCYQRHGTATIFEARGEESGEWLVLDAKRHPPRVICRCHGWSAPKNAALIAAVLEAHDLELYSKFALEGSGRLNEQAAVKASLPSGEVNLRLHPSPRPESPGRGSGASQVTNVECQWA